MKSEQAYVIHFNGQKPIRFRIAATRTPTTFTISPHDGDAIVTIVPAANSPESIRHPKPSGNVFSRKNVQGVLRALRAELNRRDSETSRTP